MPEELHKTDVEILKLLQNRREHLHVRDRRKTESLPVSVLATCKPH